MNDECYRLLIFRYVFLLGVGIYAYENSFNLFESVVMTMIGGIFLGITTYEVYAPRIITSWTSTCFLSVMWIVPIIVWLLRRINLRFKPIETIGWASYDIFLVQMVYYRSYRIMLVNVVTKWELDLLLGIVICVFTGIILNKVETRLTKITTRKVMNYINRWTTYE